MARGVLQKFDQKESGQRWRFLCAREERVLVLPQRAKNRPKKGEGPQVAASVCAEASGHGEMRDWPVFEEKDQGVETRQALEKQFEAFFRGLVSEWNPIRDDAGRWRYRWDAEVGAHDLSLIHI